MSHLIMIYAVCKFSYFCLWYLNKELTDCTKLHYSPKIHNHNIIEQLPEFIMFSLFISLCNIFDEKMSILWQEFKDDEKNCLTRNPQINLNDPKC